MNEVKSQLTLYKETIGWSSSYGFINSAYGRDTVADDTLSYFLNAGTYSYTFADGNDELELDNYAISLDGRNEFTVEEINIDDVPFYYYKDGKKYYDDIEDFFIYDGKDAQPVIVLGSPYAVDTGSEKKVSCAAARSVPEGYTVIKAGMLYARNSVLSEDAFELDNDGVGEYVAKSKTQEGIVTLNVKVDNEDVKVSFRGYMVLKDNESGTTATYYTDLVEVRYSELV